MQYNTLQYINYITEITLEDRSILFNVFSKIVASKKDWKYDHLKTWWCCTTSTSFVDTIRCRWCLVRNRNITEYLTVVSVSAKQYLRSAILQTWPAYDGEWKLPQFIYGACQMEANVWCNDDVFADSKTCVHCNTARNDALIDTSLWRHLPELLPVVWARVQIHGLIG